VIVSGRGVVRISFWESTVEPESPALKTCEVPREQAGIPGATAVFLEQLCDVQQKKARRPGRAARGAATVNFAAA